MGAKQGLENVIECARLAHAHSSELVFVLMGDGSQRTALTRLTSRYRLRNVRFLEPQPDGVYESFLRAADILIVNQRHSLIDMALPSKLAAYLAAGRPIVAAVHEESETALELHAAAAGIVCSPESPSELLSALNSLAYDSVLRDKLGTNGADYCEKYLDQTSVLPRWASFVEHLSTSQAT
jgi:colanic acid biosynthesis glycosyl transferase WcaI